MWVMVLAAATAVRSTAGRGADPVTGLIDRRLRRGGTSFAPVYCEGLTGSDDDDNAIEMIDGAPGTTAGRRGLWVHLSQSGCISATIPLLATYLGDGIMASDLICIVRPAT